MLTRVAADFPTVTTVRVKDALAAVNDLVGNLIAGIRGASTVTLIAAVLVLAGALAAGHRHRVYDAVILKTLGATRGRLLTAYGLEYAMLGAVTATFGVLAGSLAGWAIVSQAMRIVVRLGLVGGAGLGGGGAGADGGVRPRRHLAGAGRAAGAGAAASVMRFPAVHAGGPDSGPLSGWRRNAGGGCGPRHSGCSARRPRSRRGG